MRRARPLLGTIVEIQASGNDAVSARAISAGFAAIEKVHRLMSFHEPQSDVSRLNFGANRCVIKVHPWTWKVLKTAQRLSSASDGVFDITVAPTLAAWGFLPQSGQKDPDATWRDIFLEENCGVRFARNLSIDLGGIAKGFAVDRAVEAMRRNGVRRGFVNAGGDVRVFGRNKHIVQLRHPAALCATAAAALSFAAARSPHPQLLFFAGSDPGRSSRPYWMGETGKPRSAPPVSRSKPPHAVIMAQTPL